MSCVERQKEHKEKGNEETDGRTDGGNGFNAVPVENIFFIDLHSTIIEDISKISPGYHVDHRVFQ